MANESTHEQATILGHPVGLYTLFFAEMWERFSYYGMRALLVFYMMKGFLGYGDGQAYTVYGAYTALVYMTPFFGGMLADKVIGPRRAVILGGLLMAAGHLAMTQENFYWFYTALALLIVGNGFFKPNISTIVGSLYPEGSPKRDGGFTIFYMGINLGAAMSPLLCGYIGETYGWHKGFGLATIGMLSGVAVFAMPNLLSQVLLLAGSVITGYSLFFADETQIVGTLPGLGETTLPQAISLGMIVLLVFAGLAAFLGLRRDTEGDAPGYSRFITGAIVLAGALFAAFGLFKFHPDNFYTTLIYYFVAVALVVAALVACLALSRGGLPAEAGAAPKGVNVNRAQWWVYLGSLLSIPVFMLLVCGFEPLNGIAGGWQMISEETITKLAESDSKISRIMATVVEEISRPAGLVLFLAGIGALAYLVYEMFILDKIRRDRMLVVLILTFFSMLFWSFFEQAGSSVTNFTDRNVDRVRETRVLTEADVGTTIQIQPTQEQLGYSNGDQQFSMDSLNALREENEADPEFTVDWTVADDNVGMGVAERMGEIPASTLQSVNPIYILIFGLVFTGLWAYLGAIGKEPSIPLKFAFGLLQLGLGFGAFWYGAVTADSRGMVALVWLLIGYLLQTTGELCLSPVGLSMVTKLSPKHLVSTVMGTWFLATAFSLFLAAIIAQFTDVSGGGASDVIPIPAETVNIYGGVFQKIAIFALGSAAVCFILVPFLKRWMHEGEIVNED